MYPLLLAFVRQALDTKENGIWRYPSTFSVWHEAVQRVRFPVLLSLSLSGFSVMTELKQGVSGLFCGLPFSLTASVAGASIFYLVSSMRTAKPEVGEDKFVHGDAIFYLASAAASCAEAPFRLLRTRTVGQFSSSLSTLWNVGVLIRREGILGLMRGQLVALLEEILYEKLCEVLEPLLWQAEVALEDVSMFISSQKCAYHRPHKN
jgi:hypothetical protein